MITHTRKLRVLATLVLPGALLASAAVEAEDSALPSGGAHHVIVTSYPTIGLEVGMPRRGWYAKGIKLDIKGEYQKAYMAYVKAEQEFRELQQRRPRWKKQIRGWMAKAHFQRDQSSNLRSSSYSSRYYSSYRRYRNASGLHHKWLAIRAFTGRYNRDIQKKIIKEYEELLTRSSYDHKPRLMLAALYNELGQRKKARREFDKIPTRYMYRYEMELAYYYTTAGDREKAFQYLKKSTRYYSYRRLALQSNLFDRLRADPRFKKLLGEP